VLIFILEWGKMNFPSRKRQQKRRKKERDGGEAQEALRGYIHKKGINWPEKDVTEKRRRPEMPKRKLWGKTAENN